MAGSDSGQGSVSSESPPKSLPVRPVKHLKVRTGCVTCKLRRVKCDEAKPACKRCTDTGRKCDGYTDPKAPSSSRRRATQSGGESSAIAARREIRSKANLATIFLPDNCIYLSSEIKPEHQDWIQFFSSTAAPSLSSLIDHGFWTTYLPQISRYQPAVKHALLAASRGFARFQERSTQSDAMAKKHDDYILQQYNTAISHLQQHLSTNPDSVEVPLLCCVLFVCLECLYGNIAAIFSHLQNGLNILRMTHDPSNEKLLQPDARHQITQIFRRLDAQSTLFGRLANFQHGLIGTTPLHMPPYFPDLETAQAALNDLSTAAIEHVRILLDDRLAGNKDGNAAASMQTFEFIARQRQLETQHKAWKAAFAMSAPTFLLQDPSVQTTIDMFNLQLTASNIYLSGCLECLQGFFEQYHEDFANIVRWSRGILAEVARAENTSDLAAIRGTAFVLDMNLVPPLYLVALRCRDSAIRRAAVSLLELRSQREGMWDAKLHARIARRVIEIEEDDGLGGGGGGGHGKEIVRPGLVDRTYRYYVVYTDILSAYDERSRSCHLVFDIILGDDMRTYSRKEEYLEI